MRIGIKGLIWLAVLAVLPAPALAQQKDQVSDKTVTALMQYAWAMTPAEYIAPDGKVTRVDKSKFNDVKVPLDVARETVRVGRLSALAQVCDLTDAQTANFQTFMAREAAKNKWSDQQMLFINQLHLFTLMTMTSQVKLVDSDQAAKGGGAAKEEPQAAPAKCSDVERKRVEDQIIAYINSTPGDPAGKGGAPAKK